MKRQPNSQFKTALRTCVWSLGVGGIALIALASHIHCNTTPSAPLGFYWYSPLPQQVPLHVGQRVRIAPPAWAQRELRKIAPHLDPSRPWMKTVAAAEGDSVCLAERVTINGVPRAARPLLHSYPLSSPAGCTLLPANTYFVMSDHPRSFDGRYIGPLPREAITGTLTPLWTWRRP